MRPHERELRYAAQLFLSLRGLPISEGSCDANVWVVINGQDENSYITLPKSGINTYLNGNLEDGHFGEVCLENGYLEVGS